MECGGGVVVSGWVWCGGGFCGVVYVVCCGGWGVRLVLGVTLEDGARLWMALVWRGL